MAVVLPSSATTFLSGGQVSPNEGRCVSFMKKFLEVLNTTLTNSREVLHFTGF